MKKSLWVFIAACVMLASAGIACAQAYSVVTVLPDGSSRFEACANGNHRYLIIKDEQRARTLEAMILLASEPPAGSARH